VDDILVIHHLPEDVIKKIDKYFPLKPGSVGKPDMYLGTKLREIMFTNVEKAWAMSPSKYVQESVSNCVKHVKANMSDMFSLPKKAINPFTTDYEPMEDGTPELDAEHASYYQQLIGIMRWMVEIVRIDIDTQVSMLASHVALPRQGHMCAALPRSLRQTLRSMIGRSFIEMLRKLSHPSCHRQGVGHLIYDYISTVTTQATK
jgi:hypothetical protein